MSVIQVQRPGVFVTEQTAGASISTVSFNRIYMVGTASALATGRLVNQFYQVTSYDDFINQFGGSSAVVLNTVTQIFNFYTNAQLYFSAVQVADTQTVAVVDLVATGEVFTLTFTVSGTDYDVSYTAGAGDGYEEVITALLTGVNNDTTLNLLVEVEAERANDGTPVYTGGVFYVRSKVSGEAIPTLATAATLLAEAGDGTTTFTDWNDTIAASVDEQLSQGYLIVPEAFYTLTKQGDRTAVQQKMEAECSRDTVNWVGIIDFGPPSIISDLAAARAERTNYTSLLGHTWYIGPWPLDSDNDHVSPAAMQAVVACKRTVREGLGQPPAGTKYPLLGLTLPYRMLESERESANEENINILFFINTRGVCVYGARTLSAKKVYRFCNRRVILNTLIRTIRLSIIQADIVFSLLEGQSVLFNRVKAVMNTVLYSYWFSGLLFGGVPEEAYVAIVDASTNPDLDIEDGVVQGRAAVKVSPTAERIFITIAPTPINAELA